MKKYYAWFSFNDEPYVIMFKMSGLNLVRDGIGSHFVDRKWYTRSIAEMVCQAALGTHPLNDERFGSFVALISHDQFKQMRADGVKRWKPTWETIEWR